MGSFCLWSPSGTSYFPLGPPITGEDSPPGSSLIQVGSFCLWSLVGLSIILGLCPKGLNPLTPFSRGHIRPPCAPERMATASLFFGRHLMMPCYTFGRCFFGLASLLCLGVVLNTVVTSLWIFRTTCMLILCGCCWLSIDCGGSVKARLPIFSCNLALTLIANVLCVNVLCYSRKCRLFYFCPNYLLLNFGKLFSGRYIRSSA